MNTCWQTTSLTRRPTRRRFLRNSVATIATTNAVRNINVRCLKKKHTHILPDSAAPLKRKLKSQKSVAKMETAKTKAQLQSQQREGMWAWACTIYKRTDKIKI